MNGSTCEKDLMEKMDVTNYLVLKKAEDDGPEIRGGYTDGLIIMATKATKNGGMLFLHCTISFLDAKSPIRLKWGCN